MFSALNVTTGFSQIERWGSSVPEILASQLICQSDSWMPATNGSRPSAVSTWGMPEYYQARKARRWVTFLVHSDLTAKLSCHWSVQNGKGLGICSSWPNSSLGLYVHSETHFFPVQRHESMCKQLYQWHISLMLLAFSTYFIPPLILHLPLYY